MKTRRTILIGIPYAILVVTAIYVFFDWYNSVPYDAEQNFTEFEQPQADWKMVQRVKETFPNATKPSHCTLLYSGRDAISARLAIIERAEHTIDIQYFLIKPDAAGAIFSDALIRASKRGVRVRFLIDDVFTTTTNEQMRFLASYPGIEVRVFNPLSRKVWKYANYVLDPLKANRRMHNKSLTVDGIVGVVGGRNIADEYYDLSTTSYFADLDILLAGDIIKNIGRDFDFFWNDELAVDALLLLGSLDQEKRDKYYDNLKSKSGEAIAGVYKEVVDVDFLEEISNEQHPVYDIDGYTVVDQPAKLRQSTRGRQHYPVMAHLEKLINAAKESVIVTSPYFVPEDWGSEMFQNAARRGVETIVVTNSLDATNHVYVHGGYYYRRPELLSAGVRLFEVRADAFYVLGRADEEGNFPHLTMHTKLFIIDKRYVFIGSTNFDPRSMYLNTEFGVILDSPELAADLIKTYSEAMHQYAYEMKIENADELWWIFNKDNPTEKTNTEPAPWYRRFIAVLAHVVPVELQY